MQTRKVLLSIACLLVAGAIGFLLAARRQENLTTPVIRTYKVASDRTFEIKNALSRLLATPGGESGTAQVFGNGMVLVRAPIGYQRGISNMIDLLASDSPKSRVRLRLDYYMVMGQTGKDSNIESFKDLAPVLSSIAKVDGSNHFRLLEHLATVSHTGDESSGEGSMLKAISTTYYWQQQLNLKVSLDSWFGKVKTNTEIVPGDYLILGQNAQTLDEARTRKFGEGNVYYVVHAEILK
jgi:hypothetical protein